MQHSGVQFLVQPDGGGVVHLARHHQRVPRRTDGVHEQSLAGLLAEVAVHSL
jgi:hypothetical protein